VTALTVQVALAIALNCAPGVDAQTAVIIAKAESGLSPLAVHDNTVGVSYAPETPDEAIKAATDLIVIQRHSVDLGLMQITSANPAAVRGDGTRKGRPRSAE
jgi:hypothetical protein